MVNNIEHDKKTMRISANSCNADTLASRERIDEVGPLKATFIGVQQTRRKWDLAGYCDLFDKACNGKYGLVHLGCWLLIVFLSSWPIDRKVYFPPCKHLYGRGGGVRFKGRGIDQLVLVLCFPPAAPGNVFISKQINEWVIDALTEVGARCKV